MQRINLYFDFGFKMGSKPIWVCSASTFEFNKNLCRHFSGGMEINMKRREREYLGIALLFSAFMLVCIFIITCIRKKNLLAAIAAVAAIDVAGGYWLLRRARKKNNGYAFDFFDEDNYEVFDDDEIESADRAIHAGFHKRQRADNAGRAARPAYEIPVDDEATEADFVR